jgi:hypothetical protein
VAPEAFKVIVPAPHLDESIPKGAFGIGLMVATTGTLVLSHVVEAKMLA